jgi:hypothetical protein
MATWKIKTVVVNPETDLRKITAVSDTNGVTQSFSAKGVMKTPEDRKKIEDNIWAQYVAAQPKEADSVATALKSGLEGRTV